MAVLLKEALPWEASLPVAFFCALSLAFAFAAANVIRKQPSPRPKKLPLFSKINLV